MEFNEDRAYFPEGWEIVLFGKKDYRVFGTWRGGYLDGDSWRLNSGIVEIQEEEDKYLIFGSSGSCYVCLKHKEHMLGIHGGGALYKLCHSHKGKTLEITDILAGFTK